MIWEWRFQAKLNFWNAPALPKFVSVPLGQQHKLNTLKHLLNGVDHRTLQLRRLTGAFSQGNEYLKPATLCKNHSESDLIK